MTDAFLAFIAALLWGGAYGYFLWPDIVAWRRRRRRRPVPMLTPLPPHPAWARRPAPPRPAPARPRAVPQRVAASPAPAAAQPVPDNVVPFPTRRRLRPGERPPDD